MGRSHSKSTTYKEGKGYCLIFNRASSHNNAGAIKITFQACGFEVKTITDCTTTNITGTLERLKTCKGCNSLVIFFHSQGYSDGIYDNGGLCLSYADILSHLTAANSPIFSDKPKIIFFSNCQMGEGVALGKGAIEDDFLIAFGTQSCTPMDKEEELEPHYIRQLLSIIKENKDKMDLESILDEVKRALSNQPDTVPQKCDYHSTLKGQVFLTKQKRQRRSHKRVLFTGKENSGIIKSEDSERIEQVTQSHSLSHSHNIVGVTTEPPCPPALERMLSTESTTTTSSQVSTNLSINQEVVGIRTSPTPSEASTATATGSDDKQKISEENQQSEVEEKGDGNDTPVKEEEGEKERILDQSQALSSSSKKTKSSCLEGLASQPTKNESEHPFTEKEYQITDILQPLHIEGVSGDLTRLTVTSTGLIHHCSQYGVTLIIPEGAVQQPANVWFGACLYGHKINFGDYVPVTPIVRVHVDTELKKPAELYLPHHVDDTDPVTRSKLTLLTADDDLQSELSFTTNSKEFVMDFQSGLCKISGNHFCSSCIAFEKTNQSIKRKYMVAMAEKQGVNMTFHVELCVFPSQKGCTEFVENHYSKRGFTTVYDDIKFDESGCISIQFEPDKLAGWKRTPEGFQKDKILENDVDYFEAMGCKGRTVEEEDIKYLKKREEQLLYPPRFRYKFQCTKWFPDTEVKAVIGPEQKTVYLFTDLLPLPVLPTEVGSDNSCLNIPSEYDDILLKLLLVLDNGFIEGNKPFHFGYKLGLSIDQLHTIEKNYKEKVHVREILIAWRRKNPNELSLKPVADALKSIGLDSLARQLEGQLEEGPGMVKIHPDAQQPLGIHSLGSILLALNDVNFGASAWDTLGLHLGLCQPKIDEIKRENADNCQQCLKKTIEAWLKCQDNVQEATVQGLIKAVKSTGENAAANELHKKFNVK